MELYYPFGDYKATLEILGTFKGDEVKTIKSFSEFKNKIEKHVAGNDESKNQNGTTEKLPESIGVATMQNDGTLHMQLRSEDHGMIAEALKIVKPTDADYKTMLKHLGGMKVGESKPIPPFMK